MNVPTPSKFEIQLGKLYQRINYERQTHVAKKSFDLRKMRGLVERLGSPELKYPVIHVAGTKGKGSVCTMLGSILTAAGLKTGVYTSPHLETIHQRMRVDGIMVSDQQMLEIFEHFEPIVLQYDQWLESQNRRPVTFFEFTTAMAMQFFANQACDAVVLETGLGGRLDSTNVCQPHLCIITNISLDHTKQLGDNLEKIAFEKAGIIKPGVPVINGVTGEPCQQVVEEIADQRNSRLLQRDRDFSTNRDPAPQTPTSPCSHDRENRFSFHSRNAADPVVIHDLKTNMLGRHQIDNAALAIAAAMELRSDGWKIDENAIRNGLLKSQLAGRMEQVGTTHRPVILDMAHNPASATALANYLTGDAEAFSTAQQRRLIFATTKEKDCNQMLATLLPLFDQVIFTQYQNNPRAMPTKSLVEIAHSLGQGNKVSVVANPEQAWQSVSDPSHDQDFICIAGSAFLLAELRATVIAGCQSPT